MSLNILIKKNFSQIDNLSPPLSLYIEWKLVQSFSDTNILLWFLHNSFCQSSQDSSLKFCLSFQIPRRLHVLTKTKVKRSAQNVFFLQLWFPIHSSFVVSWVPIGSPPNLWVQTISLGMCWALDRISRTLGIPHLGKRTELRANWAPPYMGYLGNPPAGSDLGSKWAGHCFWAGHCGCR